MSSPKVVEYDTVYNNVFAVNQTHSKEADELIEQMIDEFVLKLKTQMPSVPKNMIVTK
jgi:hypothetical protein